MENSDFPVEEAKNRRYSGWESGIPLRGVVADVIIEDGFVKVINTAGRVAIAYDVDLGSWDWQGDKIVISVPMMGVYELSRPKPL